MRSSAHVVVIGGGVVGASVLYHLTKAGVTDAVLLERSELTSGSTWHAAGGMHTLNGDPNVAGLQKYTVELYDEIQRVSGIDCGIHLSGGVLLADTEERMDWLRLAHARNRYLGLETELISVAEAKKFVPVMDEKYFVGAMFDPVEGNVDPSGVTRAFARSAQLAGAEVVQHTRVESIRQLPDQTWELDCGEQGTITCEHFVNAGGLWAREVGRMCGLELPVLAMEHMYLVTEPVPELDGSPMFHAMDFSGEVYMRKEGDGLLLGTYEPNGVPWSPQTTPWEFGHQLLTPDLDRISENLVAGVRPLPGLPRGRHQVRDQRAVHLRPRRQPARRAGPWPARPLGRLRRDGRAQPGRRRRAGAGQLDHAGRSRLRRVGDGRRAVRRVGHPGVHEREGARELRPPVPDRLPQRAAPRGAPADDHPDPRPAGRGQRRLGCVVRAGARAVVPAQRGRRAWGRAPGDGDPATVERLGRRRRGEPGRARGRRPDRDDELREVRVHRARRAGAPRPDPGQPAARRPGASPSPRCSTRTAG